MCAHVSRTACHDQRGTGLLGVGPVNIITPMPIQPHPTVGGFPVLADSDALLHKAKRLMATGAAMLHTMDALHRKMEKSIDDNYGRIDRTNDLLASNNALLQQAKSSMLQN
jgi:hypothetical protein